MTQAAHHGFDEAAMLEAVKALGSQILDPWWRLTSGKLYHIMTKGDELQPGSVVPFIPNEPQMQFVKNLWHLNVILKARQLGFTTLISILWLDHALWNPDQRCGIIAQDRDTAGEIFRDKVKLAYNRLPEVLRIAFPLATETATELMFGHNNSSIRVASSYRGGTPHRLHVSELGKTARDFPLKAKEIVEGSLTAVPTYGVAVVESTAEGAAGEFHEISMRAEALHDQRKVLSPMDYRFHFFPWHDNPLYVADPRTVVISAAEHEYFDKVGTAMRKRLTMPQRAFYIATRDGKYHGRTEAMWTQYPSTPAECWQVSTEGVYYAGELALARMQGRIGVVPFVSNVPVNSFWDIGSNDGTGVWLHQRVGAQNRFLRYLEGWFKGLAHFIAQMDALSDEQGGIVWGTHFLPHDAEALRQGLQAPVSALQSLESVKPSWNFQIVERIAKFEHGIQAVRDQFGSYVFDEEGCKEGLAHLQNYRQKFNTAAGGWTGEPVKDLHTEAADSLRQHAQGWTDPTVTAGTTPKRSAAARRMA